MESQLSNIFRVKLVAKNTVLGPPVDPSYAFED